MSIIDQATELRKLVAEADIKTDIKSNTEDKNGARIITISSGKGGVGKSNFAVNVAIGLRRQNKKVLIFDADIGMGNDDVLLGLFPKYNVLDYLKKDISLEEATIEGPEGIHLLPGGSGLSNIDGLSINERRTFARKIKELETYDYILIDTGAGVDKNLLAFIQAAQEAIIILTPEPTSLTDAYSLLKSIHLNGIKKKISIVINKVSSNNEAIQTYEKFNNTAKKFLGIDTNYLGDIVEDKNLVMAVKSQSPLLIEYPKAKASICIKNITNKIVNEIENSSTGNVKSMFSKIFNFFS